MTNEMRAWPVVQPAYVIHPTELGVNSPIVDVQICENVALFRHQDGTFTELGQGMLSAVTADNALVDAVEVQSNGRELLARYADGRVRMWGEFLSVDVTMPTDLTDVVQIGLNRGWALALRRDGSVVTWGSNHGDQCVVPDDATNIAHIAVGMRHVVARRHDGTLVTWGRKGRKQAAVRAVPTTLPPIHQLCAGLRESAIVTPDGELIMWGVYDSDQPEVPAGLPPVTQVALGMESMAVLTADQQVIVWGRSWMPETEPQVIDVHTSVPVVRCHVPAELGRVVRVVTGDTSADIFWRSSNAIVMAIMEAGSVVVWRPQPMPYAIPATIPAGAHFHVSLGGMVALCPNGQAQLWPNDVMAANPYYADVIAKRSDIAHVDLGPLDPVLGRDGTLVLSVMTDDGNRTCAYANIAQIVTMMYEVYARKTDGSVVLIDPYKSEAEQVVAGLTDVVHLVTNPEGGSYLVAVRRDGTVVLRDLLDTNAPATMLAGFHDVWTAAVNEYGSVIGVRHDGSVVLHRGKWDLQVPVPADVVDVVQVHAIQDTFLALRRDGRVVAWGVSRSGWCAVPADLTDVQQLVGRVYGYMVAVRHDGTLVAWGNDVVTDVPLMVRRGHITRRT